MNRFTRFFRSHLGIHLTALISAAVTGKIDVRDWVAPDTQDIEASQEAIV